MDRLARYRRMRDFDRTPEPSGPGSPSAGGLRFSVQKHAATRLHWDLRLEWDGALLSWAVTRGPSLDPAQKRLAVRTEDHPLDYLDFQGTIPEGYGAGTVLLWDIGWWSPLSDMPDALAAGMIKLRILSHRMSGAWMLVRMKERGKKDAGRENWLLVKERDSASGDAEVLTRSMVTSVRDGRTLKQIADGTPPKKAQTGKRPGFRKPQLATLRDSPPEGAVWRIEPKHDGYRALIALGMGGPRIFTRNGHDWSDRFETLRPYLAALPCESALLDGEAVAGLGAESFGALQSALANRGPLAVYLFDLLHLNGRDLASEPLDLRRIALERLLAGVAPLAPVRLSPSLSSDGPAVLAAICKAGGEGIVAKRGDAAYRGRRTTGWLKVKCQARDEFVIAGYVPSDRPGRPFASLVMATRHGKDLIYRGRVGTGFDEATMEDIAKKMAQSRRKTTALSGLPDEERRGTVWVTPDLVAEVRHAGLTESGRIRHGAFVGLREDKPARTVTLETATKTGVSLAGQTITSPKRVVFPDAKVSKLDLARYYDNVAPAMLRSLADRPLSLLRHPAGLSDSGFFQRHASQGFPAAIHSLPIMEKDGSVKDYIHVADAGGLVACAQMGTIEFHLWGARRDRIERPDRMVFDLDPDPTVGFAEVRRAAVTLRDRLSDLGLPSDAIVTGGKGVHVVVPLRRTSSWDTYKGFARTFAAVLAEKEPGRFTANMSKARRKGRIFIDWMRNERGATAIAPFSVRAHPGARVAVPVLWDDLPSVKQADFCTMAQALERSRSDPVFATPATLGRKVIEALEKWSLTKDG